MSPPKEAFQFMRLVMVLSSMAPLFLLWAVRGSGLIPNLYFIPACLLIAIVPTVLLLLRIRNAKSTNDCQVKTICRADDHKDHILVYLFATLLPFYTADLQSYREFGATVLALAFILFLFWHLNMHYMNLLFAVQGYRVFTVTPDSQDVHGGKAPFVILARRTALVEGQKINAYRLSDTVFIEK
jgi:hypothetical protein